MTDIRPVIKNNKWQISKHEFYTAFHYAMQYTEWVDERNSIININAINYDGMPHGSTVGNPTESKGMRSVELKEKIDMIEQTVREADESIYTWLLKGVTCEGCSYNYLSMVMHIPCGKNVYYNSRRKFYYLLAKKIGISGKD